MGGGVGVAGSYDAGGSGRNGCVCDGDDFVADGGNSDGSDVVREECV